MCPGGALHSLTLVVPPLHWRTLARRSRPTLRGKSTQEGGDDRVSGTHADRHDDISHSFAAMPRWLN